MRYFLPGITKHAVKGWLKSQRLRYVRWRYAFGPRELASFLQRLGVRDGDVVLVHSSFDQFEGFVGKATDIIVVLQQVVGRTGTLLMPTLPFTGTAIEFARSGQIFDVRRTPSRMGMLTELFRRTPGVVRSVHPTHAVAAWGAKAELISANHHTCVTPCARLSPYGKLLDYDGRILLLGTGIGVLTFFHTAEDILEPIMPFSPFTDKYFHLTSRTEDGTLVQTTTRLFNPQVSRRRSLEKVLAPALKERDNWKEARLGTLNAILLDAKDVLRVICDMASKGEYCYER